MAKRGDLSARVKTRELAAPAMRAGRPRQRIVTIRALTLVGRQASPVRVAVPERSSSDACPREAKDSEWICGN
jgi:hypothetical protein